AGQSSVKIVNILGTQTVSSSCLNGTTGVNASGQEFFCTPAVTSSTAPGINSLDLPRLNSSIDDLLGRVFSVTQGFVATNDLTGYQSAGSLFINDARYGEYDFYFQDTWKFRPNITIDLGLRNEVKATPVADGRLYAPDSPVRVGEKPTNALKWVHRSLYD